MERVKRIEKIKRILSIKSLDGILISRIENVRYLSGFTGDTAILLIGNDLRFLLTDGRYTLQAKEGVIGFKIIEIKKAVEGLADLLKSYHLKRIGFESDVITYDLYQDLTKRINFVEWIPIKEEIQSLRAIKEDKEILLIKEAAKMADDALKSIFHLIKPGAVEKDLSLALEFEIKKRADDIAFDIIVASGANSAMPHAVPSKKKIDKGDFIIIDFGAKYKGYHSDETVTFGIGFLDDNKKKIWQIVKDAQAFAFEVIKPNIEAKKVDETARNYIDSKGYGKYFSHGTGHGVGLAIHEYPYITSLESGILKENMVFTVEPGIYIPNLGGVRIEDTIVVTNDGFKVLTNYPKEVEII
ncbi:MAG: aminopeptidase P family protein [Deltaproteobacteria bacterium]|nr:aminopeptidase P family protein [Deltaproteobacteria bacterium]